MAAPPKKLLIVADDHPRIRDALEYIVAELHGSVTFYTADSPRSLLPLAEKRLAGATDLTVVDIKATAPASTGEPASQPPGSVAPGTEAGPPLLVVSTQERGITAHWFAPLGSTNTEGQADGIQAALDQRSVVMDLVRSLRDAAQQPGAAEQEALYDLPDTESLMRLGLTRRQAEVLLALAQGMTNKEIARQLQVSEWTVRHHVSAVLERLEVSNRGRAAMFARRLGGA